MGRNLLCMDIAMGIYLHNWDITPMVKHLDFFFSSMWLFSAFWRNTEVKKTGCWWIYSLLVNYPKYILSNFQRISSLVSFKLQQSGDDQKKSRRPSWSWGQDGCIHRLPSGKRLQFANWKIAIESSFVDLPSSKMVDLSMVFPLKMVIFPWKMVIFHGFWSVYQAGSCRWTTSDGSR